MSRWFRLSLAVGRTWWGAPVGVLMGSLTVYRHR